MDLAVERMTRLELATSTMRQSVALGAIVSIVERMTGLELATSTMRQSVAPGGR